MAVQLLPLTLATPPRRPPREDPPRSPEEMPQSEPDLPDDGAPDLPDPLPSEAPDPAPSETPPAETRHIGVVSVTDTQVLRAERF
jgi:hypothetical protein